MIVDAYVLSHIVAYCRILSKGKNSYPLSLISLSTHSLTFLSVIRNRYMYLGTLL